ncbi:substrate-binding periplasmic protein [Roseateles cellulosilyticus]|uniref:Transporter substrate-binding domain-containing protein n=1 Tax=Pelomonas cellulosilytica TaxID=2906762 RepID=A0ABS8XVB3_9BURK|nr:transporter substrate-binding domain-containing protein [Pelomonas sp. P8]MCE4554832.1 transporter substrate-binding domain-containing protein [Pelomonas sp. P8]
MPRHLLTSILLLCAGAALAQGPLTIEYRDKPPYSYTEAGKPAGFLMERTARVLTRAGLDVRYAEVPVRRTLQNLQADREPLCSPGFYKNAERQAFARFSLPIHRDRPQVVLAHRSVAPQIRRLRRLAQLFADASLQPGVLEGVSYGVQLDQYLAAAARPPLRAQHTPLQLARMVAMRRADYMFIDEEDYGWLRKEQDFAELPVVRIEFTDMPRGELRYLVCSRQVLPQTMERINQAIRAMQPETPTE